MTKQELEQKIEKLEKILATIQKDTNPDADLISRNENKLESLRSQLASLEAAPTETATEEAPKEAEKPKEPKEKKPKKINKKGEEKKEVTPDDADCYAEIDKLKSIIENMKSKKSAGGERAKPKKKEATVAISEGVSRAVNSISAKVFSQLTKPTKKGGSPNYEGALKRLEKKYTVSAKDAEGKEVTLETDFVGAIALIDKLMKAIDFGFSNGKIQDKEVKPMLDYVDEKIKEIKEKIKESQETKEETE